MVVATLDHLRAQLLRLTLRPPALRRLYTAAPERLFAGFLLAAAIYLPLALRRPQWLLVFGPMIFGYPHLIASYRFLPARRKRFAFFAALTAFSLGLNELALRRGWIPELPFGAWELAVAALAAIALSRRVSSACLAAASGWLLWKLSWREPLVFAGGALLLHNWVAFGVWIRKSEGRARAAAIAGAGVFGLVHFLVFRGYADSLLSPATFEPIQYTGAVLAPWSRDPLTWYRAITLYTFGLSMHYYVWLKAIPECRGRVPLSWRRTLELLKRDLGAPALVFSLGVAGVGIAVWCANLPLGDRIYFRIATLHGWLELMFLITSLRAGFINMLYLDIKHLAAGPYNIIYLIRRRANS